MKLRGIGPKLQRLFILTPRFFVVPLLVQFLTACRTCRARCQDRQHKRQNQRPGVCGNFTPTLVEKHRDHQQRNAQPERPLVALNGAVRHPGIDLFLPHPAKPLRNQAAHVGGAVLQPRVESAGRLRDAGERLLIQARFHKLPVRPLHKLRVAV